MSNGVSMRRAPARAALLGALLVAFALAGCGGSGGVHTSSSSAQTTSPASRHGGLEVDAGKKIRYAKVPSSAPTQSGLVRVAYRDLAIDPDTVRVKLGSTIEWTNYDSVPHNVTSEGGPLRFHSGDLPPGKSYELKLTRTGVIHYECTLQPTTMNGTIEVVG